MGLDQALRAASARSRRRRRGTTWSARKCRAWWAFTSSSVSREISRADAPRVAGVGVVAVNQAAEDQVGAEGRVVAVALQLGRDPPLGPGQRLGRERGAADHVGQHLERQRQVLGADPHRGPRRPTSSVPPTSSIASASASADRVGVPSSSIRPVRNASPGFASRSRPASTNSSSATIPVPGRRSVTSRRPLASAVRCGRYSGQLRARPSGRPGRVGRSTPAAPDGPRGLSGKRLRRQQDRDRAVRPRERPADRQVGVGQIGRGDPADVVGLDGEGRRGARPARRASRPRARPGRVRRPGRRGLPAPSARRLRAGAASGRAPRRSGPSSASRANTAAIASSRRAGSTPGGGLDLDQELPGAARAVLPGVDPGGELLALDQRVPEPRPPAAGQQVGEDVERRAVGVAARDRVPAEQPARDRLRLRRA